MPKIHYQNNKINYKTIEPHFCSKKYIIYLSVYLLCIYLSSIHVSVWKMSEKSKVCITVLKLAFCKYFLCTQRVGNVMSWKFISFKDLFLFYVYKIFAYMSVYTCTWCLWRPEGVGFGVRGGYKPPYGGWEQGITDEKAIHLGLFSKQ